MIPRPDPAAAIKRQDPSQENLRFDRSPHVSPTVSTRVSGRNITPQISSSQSTTQVISTTYTTRSKVEPGAGSNLSIRTDPDFSRFAATTGPPTDKTDILAQPVLQTQPVEGRIAKEHHGTNETETYKLTSGWNAATRTPEKTKPAPESTKYSYSDSRYDNSYYKYSRDIGDNISRDPKTRLTGDYHPTYVVYEDSKFESKPTQHSLSEAQSAQLTIVDGFKPVSLKTQKEQLLAVDGLNQGDSPSEIRASETRQDSSLYNDECRGILRDSSIKDQQQSQDTQNKPELGRKEQEGGEYFSFSPIDDPRWMDDPKTPLPQFSPYSNIDSSQKFDLFDEVQRLSDSLIEEKREKDKLRNRLNMLQEKNAMLEKELVEVKARLVSNKQNNIDSMEERLQLLKDKQAAYEKIDNLNRQSKLLADQLEVERANSQSTSKQLQWKLDAVQRELENKDRLIQSLEAAPKNRLDAMASSLHHKTNEASQMIGIDRLTAVLMPYFDRLQQHYSKSRNTYASTVCAQVSKQLVSVRSSPVEAWNSDSSPACLSNLSILLDSLSKSNEATAAQFPVQTLAKDSEVSTNHRTYERSDSQQSNKMSTGSDRSVMIQERIEIINGKPAKVKYIRREPIMTSREVSVEKKTARQDMDNSCSQQSSPTRQSSHFNITQRLVEENARIAEEFSKIKQQNKSLKEKIDDLTTKADHSAPLAKSSSNNQYYAYQTTQNFGHR